MSWKTPTSADDPVLQKVGSFNFYRGAKNTPPDIIREVLRRPVDRSDPNTAILAALVDPELPDEALVSSWKRALQLFADLDTRYSWGGQKFRDKVVGIAEDPELLAAIQQAVAGCENASLQQLAVLALDGSEISQDAAFKYFDAAMRRGDQALDGVARLRTFAPEGSTFAPLLDRVDAQLQERNDASPAMAFCEGLGLGTPKHFHVTVSLGSVETLEHGRERVYVHVTIDSRDATWLDVNVRDSEGRQMDHGHVRARDELGVGVPTPDELPEWLAQVASTLEVTWNWEDLSLRSSLRGKKRTWFCEWLEGRSTAPYA